MWRGIGEIGRRAGVIWLARRGETGNGCEGTWARRIPQGYELVGRRKTTGCGTARQEIVERTGAKRSVSRLWEVWQARVKGWVVRRLNPAIWETIAATGWSPLWLGRIGNLNPHHLRKRKGAAPKGRARFSCGSATRAEDQDCKSEGIGGNDGDGNWGDVGGE